MTEYEVVQIIATSVFLMMFASSSTAWAADDKAIDEKLVEVFMLGLPQK